MKVPASARSSQANTTSYYNSSGNKGLALLTSINHLSAFGKFVSGQDELEFFSFKEPPDALSLPENSQETSPKLLGKVIMLAIAQAPRWARLVFSFCFGGVFWLRLPRCQVTNEAKWRYKRLLKEPKAGEERAGTPEM